MSLVQNKLQDFLDTLPKEVVSHIQHLERMRQDFVANVSHELRTPLTVIHGYLEIILDQSWDKAHQKIFTQMQQQTTRMENLIEDLLLLSRLETPEDNQAEIKKINVPELINVILQEAKTLSNNSHVFQCNIQKELCIRGNEKELRSLFSNLIFNAVKYTPSGGQVDIEWVLHKNTACFTVKDTGIGIDVHHIPRLTERFYRVDPARSRGSGGTGLGLAIAKHVLLRHDGKLDIHSELGKGSVFTCIFPKKRFTLQQE